MVVANASIRHIEAEALRDDLQARVNYTKSFLNFTEDDGAALQSAKTIIVPALPAVLDTIYTKLISYDITAKSFVPHQPEQQQPSPSPPASSDSDSDVATTVDSLHLTHPNILHRKDFLQAYFGKIVGNADWSDGSKFWEYLDKVGEMHTGAPGFKHREKRPQLRVEVMHMSLLLGFVEDVVVRAVMGAEGLGAGERTRVVGAFNKLLWMQNDLFQRHYGM